VLAVSSTLVYEYLKNIKSRRILEMKDLKGKMRTVKKGCCSFAVGEMGTACPVIWA
jgi:hypothetical protein